MKYKFFVLILILFTAVGCISKPVKFDENRAFEMIKVQSKWLHRYPGGEDMPKCREYLKTYLEPNCQKYIEQDFTQKVGDKELQLKNIIGIINPKAKKYVLLCSHYDNRPICDQEKNIKLEKNPCPGANDGASSTALLLEMAKVFNSKKPDLGVVMVFFDGEDYGPGGDDMFLGSRYFAEHINDIVPKNKIKYAIVLDMIGDKNLNIFIEEISNITHGELVADVWNKAKDLGYEKYFIPSVKYAISDDHIPLIENGIKAIDIIDFDYKPWHTTRDTWDKCSPKSLKIVGDTIINLIYDDM